MGICVDLLRSAVVARSCCGGLPASDRFLRSGCFYLLGFVLHRTRVFYFSLRKAICSYVK